MKAEREHDADIRVLERLVAACNDGVEGYRHAAHAVPQPELRSALLDQAGRRAEVADVLSYKLGELGRVPPEEGSLPGAFHRAVVDVIAKVRTEPARAVLRECERGERATLHAFTEALSNDQLGIDVRNVVQSQLGRVLEAKATLDRIAEHALSGDTLPLHPGAPRDVAMVGGALTGAAAGGIAGPPGAIVGGVVGAIAGRVAGQAMENANQRASKHDAELDRDIGVTGGRIGIK